MNVNVLSCNQSTIVQITGRPFYFIAYRFMLSKRPREYFFSKISFWGPFRCHRFNYAEFLKKVIRDNYLDFKVFKALSAGCKLLDKNIKCALSEFVLVTKQKILGEPRNSLYFCFIFCKLIPSSKWYCQWTLFRELWRKQNKKAKATFFVGWVVYLSSSFRLPKEGVG